MDLQNFKSTLCLKMAKQDKKNLIRYLVLVNKVDFYFLLYLILHIMSVCVCVRVRRCCSLSAMRPPTMTWAWKASVCSAARSERYFILSIVVLIQSGFDEQLCLSRFFPVVVAAAAAVAVAGFW